MEESELLRLLQRGDPAGLEALIVRYTPYVSAVAARILPGCPREWEEVAADVFWAAWQERKKLQPGRLKGWLSVTARNRALNLLRSRRETVPLAEDILVLSGDGPQQELEAREAAGLVRTALSTLEREDRELFVRRYYYGQTVARAAEGHSAALLAHHGAVTWGRDVVQAWHRTQALEQYCKQRYLGLLLGRPIPVLEPEEVRELTVRRLAGEERRN